MRRFQPVLSARDRVSLSAEASTSRHLHTNPIFNFPQQWICPHRLLEWMSPISYHFLSSVLCRRRRFCRNFITFMHVFLSIGLPHFGLGQPEIPQPGPKSRGGVEESRLFIGSDLKAQTHAKTLPGPIPIPPSTLLLTPQPQGRRQIHL